MKFSLDFFYVFAIKDIMIVVPLVLINHLPKIYLLGEQ